MKKLLFVFTLLLAMFVGRAQVDCNSFTLPFFEGFEMDDYLICWTDTSMNTQNELRMGVTEEFSCTDDRSFQFSSFSSASNYNQYLITPELPTNVAKVITFDYKSNNGYGDATEETFCVGYSTTTTDITAFVWGENIISSSADCMEYYGFAPAEAKYIAINYKSNYQYYLLVDNISITEMPSCMYPSDLAVSNILAREATISWTPAYNTTGTETFHVEYSVEGSGVWTPVTTTADSIILTNLLPETTYDVRLFMACTDGYTDTLTTSFTTYPSCMYPSDLEVSNILVREATISWTPAFLAEGTETFYVEYAEQGTTTWLQNTTTTNSVVLTNLEPGTFYSVRLFMGCTDGYSDTLTTVFTTEESCRIPLSMMVSQITGTSALVSWTPDPSYNGTQNFVVQYEEQNSGNLQTLIITDDHCFISGLTPETAYTVTLHMDCGTENGTSNNLTAEFTTKCLAGGELAVGDGGESSGYFPVTTNYNYSYSQQIFLASELGGATEFQSITFENEYMSLSTERGVKMYLVQTQANNSTTWVSTTDAQLVYEGPYVSSTGWNTYNFIAPFQYDGTSNLALIIIDTTGSYSDFDQVYWMVHEPFAECSRYYMTDSHTENISISNPPANGYETSYRCNVLFGAPCDSTTTCAAPNAVVDFVGSTEITISWVPGNTETSWTVEYKESTEDTWTTADIVTTSPYTIQNLQSNTVYDVRIGTECDGDYLWRTLSGYRTGCAAALLPFSENFDSYEAYVDDMPFCWAKGDESTPYIIGPGFSGESALYMYSGYAYYYQEYMNSIAILPEMDASVQIDSLMFSYQRKISGNGIIQIGIMSDPTDISTFEVVVIDTVEESEEWEHAEVYIRNYTGTGRYLAIYLSQNEDLSVYIDDINITYIPSCFHVNNLTAQNITTTTATITWEAAGTETSWDYAYGSPGQVDEFEYYSVSEESVVLENLDPNTAYEVWVRANCGTEYSTWETYTFRTSCVSIETLPYTENFDSYNTNNSASDKPFCWFFPVTYSSFPYIQNSSWSSYSQPNQLIFASSSSNPVVAVLPQIEVELHTLRLTFQLKGEDPAYAGTFEVGVMSDPEDLTTFESVAVLQHTGQMSDWGYETYDYWLEHVILFDSTTLSGTGNYIAFRHNANPATYNAYYYVDDVRIDLIPGCDAPANLNVANFGATFVDLEWTSVADEAEYEVYIYPSAQTPDYSQVITTNDTTYSDNTLSGNTNYTAMVRTVCSGGGYSDWVTITFATPSDNVAQLPYIYGFEDAAENTQWTLVNNEGRSSWYIGIPNGATDSVLYISGDGGVTNNYIGGASNVWAYRDVELPLAAEFEVRFKWSGEGEEGYDFMYAFFGDPESVEATIINNEPAPINAERLGGAEYVFQNNTEGTWFSQVFDSSMGESVKRLYFVWHNDGSIENPPAIRIDSVIILAHNCAQPRNVMATAIQPTTADFSFTPALPTDNSWDYVITTGTNPNADELAPVAISDTMFTVTGLTAETTYYVYVRTDCGDENSEWSVPFVFTTPCSDLTPLPYSEDFESYTGTGFNTPGVVPDCWLSYSNNTFFPAPHITSILVDNGEFYYPHSGTNSITFTASDAGADAMVILPEFATALNQLNMSFYYRMESTYLGELTVGYVANVADPIATFTEVESISSSYDTTYQLVSFTNLTDVPAGARIAFKWTNDGTYYSCGIDDILVTEEGAVTCDVPTALAVSNVSQTGATATWTAGNEETAWNVQYKEASATEWGNSINVTEATYTFSGLTAGTAYQVRVQAVCGTDETSDWTEAVSFTTLDEAAETCPAPTGLEATDVQNETITLTWSQEANTANNWTVQYRVAGTDSWSSATATAVPYTLTGLTGLTTYEIQVLANCTNGLTSDPSNMITETTTNTGISNYDLESSVILYPNPTASNVTISAQGMMESVSMYDVYGKLISTMKVNDTNATADLSSYASGVYFARITTENGVVTKRIVKK